VQKEIYSLRSEHVRQEIEMSKKNKMLEEIFGPRNSLLEAESKFKIMEVCQLFLCFI